MRSRSDTICCYLEYMASISAAYFSNNGISKHTLQLNLDFENFTHKLYINKFYGKRKAIVIAALKRNCNFQTNFILKMSQKFTIPLVAEKIVVVCLQIMPRD